MGFFLMEPEIIKFKGAKELRDPFQPFVWAKSSPNDGGKSEKPSSVGG
jgi:hypothetical protein